MDRVAVSSRAPMLREDFAAIRSPEGPQFELLEPGCHPDAELRVVYQYESGQLHLYCSAEDCGALVAMVQVASAPPSVPQGTHGDPLACCGGEAGGFEHADDCPEQRRAREEDPSDDEVSGCLSCGQDLGEADGCSKSKRPCGHHCNCSWTQDKCCWCGQEFGAVGAAEEESVDDDYLCEVCGSPLTGDVEEVTCGPACAAVAEVEERAGLTPGVASA